MEIRTNLLIIGEEPSLLNLLKNSALNDEQNVYFCTSRDDIFPTLEKNNIKVVFINLEEAGEAGFKFVKALKAFDPLLEVIVMGRPLPSGEVIEWIKEGATHYLPQPVQIDGVQFVLRKIKKRMALRKETLFLEKKIAKKYVFQGLIGKSPHMLKVFSLVDSIVKYFSTVLITGETGTGKEGIAKALHKLSALNNKALIICDCVSIPENLFESELFGYVRGAFTGANRNKKGLFEEAHKGLIFLDEIGEIPQSIQAKLLRVLESHQFRPLGSIESKEVDIRVIAATSKNLREEVKKGSFREDLLHRLNKVEVHLPPLRERAEDIPLLVRYFLDRNNEKFDKAIKGVSQRVQKLFFRYGWPGNVRELVNVIESSSIFCERDFIDTVDLPKYLQDLSIKDEMAESATRKKTSTLDSVEKEHIMHLLRKTHNNKRKTAKMLNISRSTLYNKLNKYNIYHNTYT